MFVLSEHEIKRDLLIQDLADDRAGALVSFEGWVRDHNQGKRVRSLEYQVYPELARKEGEKILSEAQHKFNLHAVHCVHRFGHLELGDIAVWVGATASHRDDAFRATRYVIDEIKQRLPIWKKEHYIAVASEWVFCRDHHTHVHFHESDYYKKQARLVDQQRLKKARVLVVGAGGLGCPALTSLAAAGVGHIAIVDDDTIHISNIHRQTLFAPGLVGEKKSLVAQKKLAELNPFIQVQSHDAYVSVDNVGALIAGKDIVLDCTDNLRSKFLLHDACFKMRIPLVAASVFKNEGQIRSFDPKSNAGCLRCAYSTTPDDAHLGNCNDYGVLATGVGMIGNIQASEALGFLQTGKNTTLHETFYFNLETLEQMKIRNAKREGCLCCSGQIELETPDFEIGPNDLTEDFAVVDIREVGEAALAEYTDCGKKVAVICGRGRRSYQAVKKLREQGFVQFYSLRGGACSLP